MNNNTGITTTTKTAIDWWDLGKYFADMSNEDQAEFLHGATVGFRDIGGSHGRQKAYIRQSIATLGTSAEQDIKEMLLDFTPDDKDTP